MAGKVKVAISACFLEAFAALPKKEQGKVTEFINKFQNNPKANGINYEKLKDGADSKICSVRIDDAYRCIVARDDSADVYLLLWVDHHDEAYAWAKRKKIEVNKLTGGLQVYDMQEAMPKEEDKEGLFESVSDKNLMRLGVPESILPFVKSISTKEDFFQSESKLPADVYENLSWLAEGFPLSEVIELVSEDKTEREKPTDLSTALETLETQKSFVVVEGEEELRRIMAEPLEKWRVFLHPTQRKIAFKNYKGSAKVLGGAGTGKTVVAMHRAKFLADDCTDHERILFTTFTANLAADIKENLSKICNRAEMQKIEVINLDAWVSRFLNEHGYPAAIKYDNEIQELWKDAIVYAHPDLDVQDAFFQEEWDRVAVSQDALTKQAYMKVSRAGRGTPLDRKKRLEVWKVFETYQNLMKEKGIRDANTAMYECTLLVNKLPAESKYKHIIVDEGQDLSANAFRLIRAMAGEPHPDDIFIAGDAHQRIYKNHAILSKCGINVVGRSSTLRINYRTTEEIRQYAFALLNGISFDDLDEATDVGDKCQSLTHGRKPEIKNFKDFSEELSYITSEVKKLHEAGIADRNICITARTKKLLDLYIHGLNDAGIRTYEIKRSKVDDRRQDGIRIATMHRVKGLEFQYMFVASVNERFVPLKGAIDHTDKVSEKESLTSEKCLLYVALTRAQKGAYITSYGKKSAFLNTTFPDS